jgi:hypothetical protein
MAESLSQPDLPHLKVETIDRGIQVLIPPDAGSARAPVRDGTAAPTRTCAECSPPSSVARSTENARR